MRTFETLITKNTFSSLDKEEKKAYALQHGAQFAPEQAEAPVADTGDLFAESGAEVVAETDTAAKQYSIQGDKVWLNQTVILNGHRIRVPVELTSIYVCQRGVRGESGKREPIPEIMSLINTIRKHGADMVNELAEHEVRFGKAGEKAEIVEDLLA